MSSVTVDDSRPRSVLIVDDDADIRDVLSMLLEDEGYKVATAENGRVALDYLHKDPRISVILLDLMMPIMTGFQFRDAQKQDPLIASIPVVVMTARGALAPDAIDAAFILPKPLPLEILLDSLTKAQQTSPSA